MARQARLKKEVELLSKEPPPGIVVWPLDESLSSLQAQIVGPDESPFAKGLFQLSITIPERYPFEPPRVRFMNPTIPYHPNIDNEGRICLDTLKSQPQGSWAPSVNINTLLLSIRLLMAHPNAEDGLMPDITDEYKRDRKLWFQKAENMTMTHASSSLSSCSSFTTSIPVSCLASSEISKSAVASTSISKDHISKISTSHESSGDEDDEEDEDDEDDEEDEDEAVTKSIVERKRKFSLS